jgi:hypothetical protein
VCACNREGTSHTNFESGWEVGVIKAFDKKGPHVGNFRVKYKDDPNWWTHYLLREGYGKDKHWILIGLPSPGISAGPWPPFPPPITCLRVKFEILSVVARTLEHQFEVSGVTVVLTNVLQPSTQI